MLIKLIILLITLLFSSTLFAQESSKSNCFEQIDSLVNIDQNISILKKDQVTVSGHFQGIKGDTLFYSNLSTKYYGTEVRSIILDKVNSVSYSVRKSRFKNSTAGEIVLVSSLVGGAIGYVIENNNQNPYSLRRESINPLVIIGSAAIGGTVSFLIYRLFSTTRSETIYHQCE